MDAKPMANILMRGAYDKVGEQVDAAVPASLGKLAPNAPKNRLGLAQWLVPADNPLTARVTVNRFWQELFGAGIVKTSDDFGIMGSAPTHPELLDWLAVEFRESDWDVKRFYKMLLTSATYRQAALITPEKIEKDHDNSLLSRGPRFRMDAEMIRDYALAASGTLSPRMGGPGTMPYQPENIWEVVGHKAMALVGGRIDAIFFCPHTNDDNCDCRKPRPGMLREIAARFNADLAGVPATGDSLRDPKAAAAVGAQPVLVLTGKGRKTADDPALPPETLVFPDLAAAAAHIAK